MQKLTFVATVLVIGSLAGGVLGGAPSENYAGATTAVAKNAGVDDGVVVCTSTGTSLGGGCLPFGAFDSVLVQDDVMGTQLAFQVCVDNNGDGRCGGGQQGEPCADDIFFSHDDRGSFFNALGPLPQGFRPGCEGSAGFPGYVVFLCEGAHIAGGGTGLPAGGTPHFHAATTGSITGTIGGTGFGNFCFPAQPFQVKEYIVL